MEKRLKMNELIGVKHNILDKGFVMLCDVMGSDHDVCEAARVSYGAGTKSISDDRTLIRYMLRHHHTSPFEMAELKFLIKVPMDCWRQWIRHRTANVNEYSTRYSEAIDDKQETASSAWRVQSTTNKQGSGGFIGNTEGLGLCYSEKKFHEAAEKLYKDRLKAGVAREQARKDLPLSTYTQAYWKIDLNNLMKFLYLRMDGHAQQEIREYATCIGEQIVSKLFPMTWEAFTDYQVNAISLTRLEIEAIKNRKDTIDSTNKREQEEFKSKLEKLGFSELNV